MKKLLRNIFQIVFIAVFINSLTYCSKKTENPVNFKNGTFPDSIINLSAVNSAFDDYNTDIQVLSTTSPLVFSSNRSSNGGQFDLVHGTVSYVFDQTTGDFIINGEMADDAFLDKLTSKANTSGNDFGPYRLYSPLDGYEYLIVSSVNVNGNLDLFYTRNLPYFGTKVPEISSPLPVNILNSGSNDAYICFDTNQDSAYFSSDADGNFDIYLHKKPAEITMDEWFNMDHESSVKADALNSSDNDKCPFFFRKFMVFASDRQGGLGGFDLYYSIFSNGNWNIPINFGPPINTSSDEYRPVLVDDEDFTNMFLMFSSNRPGGKGGFDLYFTGINFPK